MSTWKLSGRANRLMDHHRLKGHSYPKPQYWDRLYQMLEEEAEKRGRTPPPPPITHTLDHEPNDDDKINRLREQVEWADRNQLLHRIQMFFDAMPPSAWNRMSRR
jgi:hypothetical protein